MKDIGKFTNVPVEEDTIIKKNTLIEIDGLQALHQDWVWDGFAAESLIFIADEVAQLDNDKITRLALLSKLPRVGSKFTIAREREGYIFINFMTFPRLLYHFKVSDFGFLFLEELC